MNVATKRSISRADADDRFFMPGGATASRFTRSLIVLEQGIRLRRSVAGYQHLVEHHIIGYAEPLCVQLLRRLLGTGAQPIDQFLDTPAPQDSQRRPEFDGASTA